MEKDTATQDPEEVLEDQGAPESPAQETEGATPTSTQTEQPVAGETLKQFEERLKVLEARQPEVDADAIAERVRQHPSFKQSMKALTQNAVRAQMEAEIEQRTQAVNDLVEDGTLDKEAGEKKVREIAKQVKAEYAKRPAPEEEPAPPGAPPPSIKAIAKQWLDRYDLTWEDVPEFQNGNALPQNQQRFNDLVLERAADKRAEAKIKVRLQDELKKRGEAAKQVRDAEAEGALKPPSGGSIAPKQVKRTLADADRVGEAIDRMFQKSRQ